MRDFLAITKALSDETRVRLLLALREGELCVCQAIDLLGLAPSTVSRHLEVLYQARLVDRRKEGRWHYYRLVGREGPPMVREALRWVRRSLENDGTIQRDAQTLEGVLEKDVKELCACYNNGKG
ncbi:MAG: metalloregulator ArsR/SmtB family transcription factor [Pirellulales bacterium]